MPLTGFAVDDGPHNMDGLLVHAWAEAARVEAFIGRRVMDSWVDPREPYGGEVCFGHNTTPSASSISRRLSGSLSQNTSAVQRPTASVRSWIFCCPISWKAKRRWTFANWCANRRLPLSNGCPVRIVIQGGSRGEGLRSFHCCNEDDVFPIGGFGDCLRFDDCADGTTSLDCRRDKSLRQSIVFRGRRPSVDCTIRFVRTAVLFSCAGRRSELKVGPRP
jgi:hypothetical protein